jgi:hypothetical protein
LLSRLWTAGNSTGWASQSPQEASAREASNVSANTDADRLQNAAIQERQSWRWFMGNRETKEETRASTEKRAEEHPPGITIRSKPIEYTVH